MKKYKIAEWIVSSAVIFCIVVAILFTVDFACSCISGDPVVFELFMDPNCLGVQ